MSKSNNSLATGNVVHLIITYSLLGLAGMGVQAIQALADGVFAGNGLGTNAVAAIGICYVYSASFVALFNLFGLGVSTVIAQKLGAGKEEEARRAYASSVTFAIIFGVIVGVLIIVFRDQLAVLMGATPDTMAECSKIGIVEGCFLPFVIVGTTMYYATRAIGKPLPATVLYSAASVVALIWDFIMTLKLGSGAWSTFVAFDIACSGTIVLFFYLQRKTVLKIRLSDFKPDMRAVIECCKAGLPMFLIQFAVIVTTLVTNHLLVAYGGTEIELCAFSILNCYLAYLFNVFATALASGMQPVVSYAYGAKDYDRAGQGLKVGVILTLVIMVVLEIAFFAFCEPIIIFMLGGDTSAVECTVNASYIWLSVYPIACVTMTVSMYYMSINKNGLAVFHGAARMILFATPLLFILPRFFGLTGVWMAEPVADAIATIIALVFVFVELHRIKGLKKGNLPEAVVA